MAPFYKQSWFAPVASAATNFLFPSLGEAVGGGVNSLLGGGLSSGVANALGSSIVGGGIGALSSGGQGALTGALAGGLTSGLMSSTGLNGGLSGLLSNGSFSGQGAANAATAAGGVRDSSIADATGTTGGNSASVAKSGGVLSNVLGGGISPGLIAGMALMGGLGSAMSGGQKQQQGGAPVTTTDPNMTRGLSQVAFNRTQRPYEGDPRTYGMRPQHNYFDNNAVPAADGGYIDDETMGRIQKMRDSRSRSFPQQWWDDSYTGAALKALGVGPKRDPLADVEMIYRGPPGPAMGDRPEKPYDPEAMQRRIQEYRARGYADGGPVMGGMPQMPQGMPKMPPQAMMGQRPGMPPMGMGRMQGALPQGRPDGMPPMGGPGGGMRRGPMGDRAGALAAMAQQNGRAPFARGGVSGPGTGRSDEIPAVLSDGEYVIDAETVALLGDGSSKAGAQKLDELRARVRQHKGRSLSRGDISPDAKPALSYIGGR